MIGVAGHLPVTNWQVSGPSKLCSNSKLGTKEVLYTSRICCINPFTHPAGVMHLGDSLVHASPGNCIPVFNSSTSVELLFQFLIQSGLDVILLAI